MQTAKVTVGASRPYDVPDDWADGECLCEGKVPADKTVEYANRVFRERDKKWVWKVWLRVHADCAIHGTKKD